MWISMRKLSETSKREIETNEFYKKCCCAFLGNCEGRITIEHALTYQGRQIDEPWALLPLCAKHHEVDQWQDAGTAAPKDMREWIALNRTDDFSLYPKADFEQRKKYLNIKYAK